MRRLWIPVIVAGLAAGCQTNSAPVDREELTDVKSGWSKDSPAQTHSRRRLACWAVPTRRRPLLQPPRS